MSRLTGSRKLRVTALFCLAVLAALLLIPQKTANAADFVDIASFTQGTLEQFKAQFEGVTDRVLDAAKKLFAALFLCQFAWSVIQVLLSGNFTFEAIVIAVVRQTMAGMFFYWFLFDRTVLITILDSFEMLADGGLDFGDMLYFCETAMRNLWSVIQNEGGLSLEGLSLLLTGLITSIVMSYALMTGIGYVLIVQLESYIAGTLGLILLGFGGSEYTRDYVRSYGKALVHIGFKFFLARIVLFVGAYSFTRTTSGLVGESGASILEGCSMLIAQSFLFLAIIKIVPQIADTLMSGVSLNTSQAGASIRSGAAGVGATTGAGIGAIGGAYKMPGRIADGADRTKEVAGNFMTTFSEHKSNNEGQRGMGGFRAGVNAFGNTLWNTYRGTGTVGGAANRNSMTGVSGSENRQG